MSNSNCLFISTVTHEFLTCRERLAHDLRFPGIIVETQENIANLAEGKSTLLKLDDYIRRCHAVIHLIGQQTSKDGRPASKANIDELFDRYPNFSTVAGLSEEELRTLSYTQWEAWLAYYHQKADLPGLKLLIATPTAAFVPDNPSDPATALPQKQSQAWHTAELRSCARYVEVSFDDEKELSIAILRALKDILPETKPEPKVAPTRFNRHAAQDFLGREVELALLDAAWDGAEVVNVFCVIAWGGVGKTALLARWVQQRFVAKHWQNAEGEPDPLFYFDWTFYDQGTRSDDETKAGAASVGAFFETALTFFGDDDPTQPGKGARLATLVQAHRTLLVLDGLEPLQYPPNHPQAGQLTDPDLRELLETLAMQNPGLCVVSSRQALTDLRGGAARNHDLDELPDDVAIRLLQKLQVTGSDDELKKAAQDYAGHALSLILLGRYLFVAKGGDIRKRDTIKLAKANTLRETQTRNAWNVLDAYQDWLQSPDGNPEDLEALRLTGLFDRPASPDCLAALRAEPAIDGLTDRLVPLDNDEWNALLHRLHDARLIQLRFPEETHVLEAREVSVDAHPLIREYFAKQVRERQPDAVKTAHSRLYDHLFEAAPKRTLAFGSLMPWSRSKLGKVGRLLELTVKLICSAKLRSKCLAVQRGKHPPSIEDLQPLYQAVVHGCLAGRQQEVWEMVYVDRIQRDNAYSERKLGAIGADLEAVAAFFEQPWNKPSRGLDEAAQAWLLNASALCLRSLGRLTEALEPSRIGMKREIIMEDWPNASTVASNLSELEVARGRLREAVVEARRAIDFADRSADDWKSFVVSRSTAAATLHQSGEQNEARGLFEKAEARQPQFDLLYSIRGFQFCELIIAPADRAAWQCGSCFQLKPRRQDADASIALDDAKLRATLSLAEHPNLSLLSIALDHLTLARVSLYRALLASPQPDTDYHNPHLLPALDGLRKANTLDCLPLGLLTAAQHHHFTGDPDTARRHLDEAQQIAKRGPMPLYLADVHLHRARLFHDKAELARAADLIHKHGYGRRYEELADAEAASAQW